MHLTHRQLIGGNRNFRNLLFGQYVSELGNWFNFIAGLGLVRVITDGSPMAAAILLVSRTFPFAVFAPIAGAFVDRFSRRQVMIVTDVLRGILALLFLFVNDAEDLWLVFAASVLISVSSAFFEGAKNASTPNVTGRDGLLSGTALMFSSRFLLMAVGAALGGWASAFFGYKIAFLINSASFMVSAYTVWLIPDHATREQATGEWKEKKSFIKDLGEGLSYTIKNRFAMTILVMNMFWAVGGGAINIIYDQLGGVYFAQREGWNPDSIVATFMSAAGVGLFIGMMISHRVASLVERNKSTRKYIGLSVILSGVLFAIGGYMPYFWVIVFLIFISRAIIGSEYALQETMFQRSLPDYIRGRISTIDRGAEIIVFSMSSFVAGFSLYWISPQMLMVLSGSCSAIAGIWWFFRMRGNEFEENAARISAQESEGSTAKPRFDPQDPPEVHE